MKHAVAAAVSNNTVEPVSHSKKKKRGEWTNRERVLVLCSRGSSFRERHLMLDLRNMMPHAKGGLFL